MYTGHYYDGKTSKGYPAVIELRQDGINIRITDDKSNKIEILWDVEKIHKGHYSQHQLVTLRYGSTPLEYLEVDDPDFYASLVVAYPLKKFNESSFEFLRSSGLKGIIGITAGFILLVLLSYFFVLPPVAEYVASIMPMEMETSLGNQMYEQVMRNYSINQRLTREANEYWRAMHVASPYTINITVVEEPVANAFALPGGHIIVYDGIIRKMKDYDEFAGLLAHEYSHIRLRHSARMLSRNLAGYLFISLLLNDASGTFGVLAANANSLKELSYSRQLEQQADDGGYQLLQSVHINPYGMLKLFQTLQGQKDALSVPEFINTHPLTEDRISHINERLKKDNLSYPDEHKELEDIWKEMKMED